MTITQTITSIAPAASPATMDRATFSAAAAANVLAISNMTTELNTWAGEVNAIAATAVGDVATAIGAAAADTPVAADLFCFRKAVGGVLKNITLTNLITAMGSGYAALAGSVSQVFSVAAATAAAHSVRADQVQGQSLTAFTTGGTPTAFTLTPTPAIAANATGLRFNVTLNAAPGAGPTLAVSGKAALNFKYYDSTGTKQFITAAVAPSGWTSDVIDDGTDWVLQNTLPVSAAVSPYSAIAGFTLSSIAGTNTTASLTISAGQATDSTNDAQITKASTTAWAASNGNAINGTDAAASTLANSTTYHVYMCSGASGTGSFVSASLTPTFPTGYAVSARRVGSFLTGAAGAPIPYVAVEIYGGAVRNFLVTQTLDISTTTLSTSRVAYTLNVPTGIKVAPFGRFTSNSATSVILTSGDETDAAPATLNSFAVPLADTSNNTPGNVSSTLVGKITNTSGQIGARGTGASTSLYLVTSGFDDFRRV